MLAKYHNLFKRTLASQGLSVHIHVAGRVAQQKAPVVINPPENRQQTPIPTKVTFAFPAETPNGHGANVQDGEKLKGNART